MSERIHALAQHLLQKSSVEECSLEELQHLTKRFPFFAPAQFLLLQKLKETGSPDAEAQQRKAVLYFHDPLQFDHFLSADVYTMDDVFAEESVVTDAFASGETSAAPELASADALPLTETEEMEVDDQLQSPVADPEEVTTSETIPVFPDPDIVTETAIEPSTEPDVLPAEPLPDKYPVVAMPAEEIPEATEPVTEKSVAEAPMEPDSEAVPESPEKDLSVLSKDTTKPLAGSDILFEPYHTVDYFASQGIKVTVNDLPKDKLSNQLRSFTEWLKVMKRLPAAEMGQSPQTTAEKSVANMANHSVEESEIVTEAMAEVWAKQGAREKAMETYNKLSLLNPSKKAYFAAKIENLKGS